MNTFAAGLAGVATVAMLASDPSTLVCVGTRAASAPVVVLEAGAGNGVETWSKVQPAIAEFARVCAYDRPGLRRHWSNGEPPAAPTPDAVIATLDGALTSAGERPPYVLVGHSYGGMIVRLYATRFRDRVKGVVLIDSSHEDQMRRFGAPPPVLPAPGSNVVFVGPEVFDLAAMSEALKAHPWHANVPLLVLRAALPVDSEARRRRTPTRARAMKSGSIFSESWPRGRRRLNRSSRRKADTEFKTTNRTW